MKNKSGSFAVIFHKKNQKILEILLVKRRDTLLWVLPGGGIESNETPEKAVLREVKEETGYTVTTKKKIGEYTFLNEKRKNHLYICSITSGKMKINEEAKEIRFAPIDKLPHPIHPQIQTWINHAASNKKELLHDQMTIITPTFLLKTLPKHPLFVFFYLLKLLKPRNNKLFFPTIFITKSPTLKPYSKAASEKKS